MIKCIRNYDGPTRTDISVFIKVDQHQSNVRSFIFLTKFKKHFCLRRCTAQAYFCEDMAAQATLCVPLFGILMMLINFYNVSRVQANTS